MTCEARLRSQLICIYQKTSRRRPKSHLALVIAQEMETGRPVVANGGTVPHEDTTVAPPALAQSQDGASGGLKEATEAITVGYSTQAQRNNQ